MNIEQIKSTIKSELMNTKNEILSELSNPDFHNKLNERLTNTTNDASTSISDDSLVEEPSKETKNDSSFEKMLNQLTSTQSNSSGVSNIIFANNVYQTYGEEIEKSTTDTAITPTPTSPLKSISVVDASSAGENAEQITNIMNSDVKVRDLREDSLKRISPEILSAVNNASAKHGISKDLILKVIETESDFKISTTSSAGAQGLMQLMPNTAKYLGVTNPYDVNQNIDGGTKYIKEMLTKFNGDLTLALAAYNAGPGNVSKYNGVPPFKETQNYIKKILN